MGRVAPGRQGLLDEARHAPSMRPGGASLRCPGGAGSGRAGAVHHALPGQHRAKARRPDPRGGRVPHHHARDRRSHLRRGREQAARDSARARRRAPGRLEARRPQPDLLARGRQRSLSPVERPRARRRGRRGLRLAGHPGLGRAVAADHLHGPDRRRADHDPALHASHQAAADQALLVELGPLGGRGRGRGVQGRAARGGRVPARSQALSQAGGTRAQGNPAARAAGHGQDPAGQGGGSRVERHVLRPVRVVVRRDVRRARCRAHPAPLSPGAQGGPGDHLHRRARRGGRNARQGHLGREGPDAESAAGGARRLLGHRQHRGDRRLEPAREARFGPVAARPLRPPDLRHAARPQGPALDPRGAHTRQAADRERRPGDHRPPDQRPDRGGPGQPLQRGRDLRRARPPRRRSARRTSRPRSSG